MTVKELIAQLQQVENQDMKVVIIGTDHTDFTYYNGVEETRTSLLSMDEDEIHYEVDPMDMDIDGEDEVEEVFIINGGEF